jgi:YMGG-like Gly-zipper
VEGQAFGAEIERNVIGPDGSVAIPRGSDATLVIRRVENNGDLTLDVDTITVDGRRYRVSTADQELENRRDGVGKNRRTGEFAGGGAVLGAIVGAIAGGGKGAAIGAGAGAGAGAAAQMMTRGKEVHVPAESVLRFRLDRPLRLHLLP